MTEGQKGAGIMDVYGTIISDADVNDLVAKLKAVDLKSTWERVLEVGRIVFEGLANGDAHEWQSHRAQKSISLRKLVQHPACPFRKTALNNAVSVHIFTKANPAIQHLNGIKPTHVAQVTRLPAELAVDLLGKAAACAWSVRDLRVNVCALRRAEGERRGRPTASNEIKAESIAIRALTLARAMRSQLMGCQSISLNRRQSILVVLNEIDDIATELRHALAAEKPRYFVVHSTPVPCSIDKGVASG